MAFDEKLAESKMKISLTNAERAVDKLCIEWSNQPEYGSFSEVRELLRHVIREAREVRTW